MKTPTLLALLLLAALPTLVRCAQEVKRVRGGSGRREARECLRGRADPLSSECRSQP